MSDKLPMLNTVLIGMLFICIVVQHGEIQKAQKGDPPDKRVEQPFPVEAERVLPTTLAPPLVYWKTITATVTAYEPSYRSCRPFHDGKTSTGTNAWRMNGCATDHRAIPVGTIVEIPGIGRRVVDDTGQAMRDSWSRGRYHIDVRMTYVWECRQWGTKRLKVKLYRRK